MRFVLASVPSGSDGLVRQASLSLSDSLSDSVSDSVSRSVATPRPSPLTSPVPSLSSELSTALLIPARSDIGFGGYVVLHAASGFFMDRSRHASDFHLSFS